MTILDLYAGLGGERRRANIEARGHTYITFDRDAKFNSTVTDDIFNWSADQFKTNFGKIDFVFASPPCEAFSVASIGHHWTGGKGAYIPKTQHAVYSQKLVAHTVDLIQKINPAKGWLMENPRGLLRKLPCVAGIPRVTITYCRYLDSAMKPTDLWGTVPNWSPRPMCHNGHPDHDAAPRGSRTGGTQGKKGAAERAVVPWELWKDILDAIEFKRCYSNPKLADAHRVEFLESTISSSYSLLKHLGCDMIDVDTMPFEQFIGREYSKLKNYEIDKKIS